MKYLSFAIALLVSAAVVGAQTPAGKTDDKIAKEPITLTGCVEAGTQANTFVLTHVVRSDSPAKGAAGMPQPSVSNPTATPPIASPTGTAGAETSAAIYWLDPPDKLKGHVGHKVAVVGTLDDDVDKAAINVTDDKVKIEAERGTRKVEAKQGTTAAADVAAAKTGEKQASYKVKVKSVTMISSSCS